MKSEIVSLKGKALACGFLAVIQLALLIVGCSGCSAADGGGGASASGGNGEAGNTAAGADIKVLTTVFASYDFAREIAGDQAEVKMLLPPGSESHSYQPTPQDLIQIQEADLFVYIGGESETWVAGILEALDPGNTRLLRLMDCVQTLPEETVQGMQVDAEVDGDAEEAAYDEHIWTAPRNAELMVQAISDALCQLRPALAEGFSRRTEAYCGQLEQLNDALHQVVAEGRHKTLIFGDRFPFRYLTDELGLSYFAAFPGCANETEAKPATVAFLIDKMRAEQLPVVLKIEMSSPAIAQNIADEAGVELRTLHSLHNLSRSELDAGASYLSLMEANLTVLREALG